MIKVSAIAAIGKNNVIGKKNELLWRIPDDLRRFKKLTMGHPVVMGRKTYESIGQPLPGRDNIVITRDLSFRPDGVSIFNTVDDALRYAKSLSDESFIIGGGEIYKQTLPQIDRLYLTLIDDEKEGDVFFPDYSEFKKETFREERRHEGLKYTWINLER